MEIIEVMRGCVSTRAFLENPVSKETIESVLVAAHWAPSGRNTQPREVVVVAGEAKQKIGDLIIEAL